MSHENPDLISPVPPDPQAAIQPNSPDFRETPDIEPFSDLREHFPIWLYIICGIALFLAGSSFTGFESFGHDMLDQGPGGPCSDTSACDGRGSAHARANRRESLRPELRKLPPGQRWRITRNLSSARRFGVRAGLEIAAHRHPA